MITRSIDPGVVVGVDGSTATRRALAWGAAEAALRGSALTLVHVLAAGTSGSGTWLSPGPIAAAQLALRRETEGREILADADRIARQWVPGGTQVRSELLWALPCDVLIALTRRAQMLVLGRRGQGTVRNSPLESLCANVVRHAQCLISVVGDTLSVNAQCGAVLVGVDGSPASEWATALAFDEASRRHVTLMALHAWTDSEVADIPSLEESSQRRLGDEILAERLAGWQERYPDVTSPPHRRRG